MTGPATCDYDVAVVGVGAVGGVLANLLGAQGLRTVAIDRSAEGVQLPRGVGLDGEIMRVAQTVGLAGTLEPLMQTFPGAQYLDADGNLVSTRPARRTIGSQGWPDRYQFHQPDFERVFRDGMTAYQGLDLRLGWEADEVTPGPDGGATVTATETATGRKAAFTARYVVGCDGARSLVRRAAGIKYDDLGLNQPWIVVDLQIGDDTDLPAVNTHYADPERPVIYINVVRDVRRYEFRAGPDEDLEGALEPDAITERISRWVRPGQATLLRAAVYTHRSLVARSWRQGPLLVAGDAAHQTPPFMGQGLCAGVRDASSLAWRLSAIINDGAAEDLLDGYEAERSHHARVIIEAATALGQVYTKPDKTKLEKINASIGREGQGQTPRLGPGLWRDSSPGGSGTSETPGGPGGTLAPQPRLADGTLLDDAVGYRFAVIGTPGTLAALSQPTRELATAAGFAVVEATGDAAAWLTELQAGAAIVRPDRYYYGTFAGTEQGTADLDDAVRELAETVAPRRQTAGTPRRQTATPAQQPAQK